MKVWIDVCLIGASPLQEVLRVAEDALEWQVRRMAMDPSLRVDHDPIIWDGEELGYVRTDRDDGVFTSAPDTKTTIQIKIVVPERTPLSELWIRIRTQCELLQQLAVKSGLAVADGQLVAEEGKVVAVVRFFRR
jgi:hypothetical protein